MSEESQDEVDAGLPAAAARGAEAARSADGNGRSGSGSAGGSWALLVALVALTVALGAAAYAWWLQSGRAGPAAPPAVESSRLDALDQRLGELIAAKQGSGRALDELRTELRALRRDSEDTPTRLDAVERALKELAVGGDEARAGWLRREAENYLRIANAQLGLAGDVEIAITALSLADDALAELNDPRMTEVRRELARELVALRAVPRPDVEGIVLTLGGLAERLPQLPLRPTAPAEFHGQRDAIAPEQSGTDRAMSAIRSAFSELVSVRRVNEPLTPLLSDAEESLALRSLDLELQLARLAVMRGDAGMFRRSLESARGRLERDFDQTDAEVRAALQTLAELELTDLPEELPDISGSLSALLRLAAEERRQ